MRNSRRAERSLAESDIADSATRGAVLWLRTVAAGISALSLGVAAVVLFLRGYGLLSVIPLLAAGASLQKLFHARREEKRTLTLAVETMLENRKPD